MSSNQMLEDAVGWMIKVTCPLLLIFGGFGNIMTIVVFRRLNEYSAISTFYIALALSDLVLLFSGWLNHAWLYFQFQVNIVSVHSISCKIGVYLPVMSSALSSWYLVAMTMQRAMSIVWPHRVNVVCTRNVSCVVTAVIGLVIMVSYSHLLFGVSLINNPNINFSCPLCKCSFVNVEHSYFYTHFYPLMDLLIGSLAPFVLLLVSNTILVKAVLTSVKNARQNLAVGQVMHVTARESQASALSVTLIALSLTFFVLSGPPRVLMIVYSYAKLQDASLPNLDLDSIMFALFIMYSANSAINFYLYCLTGTKFRKEVVYLTKVLLKLKNVNVTQH